MLQSGYIFGIPKTIAPHAVFLVCAFILWIVFALLGKAGEALFALWLFCPHFCLVCSTACGVYASILYAVMRRWTLTSVLLVFFSFILFIVTILFLLLFSPAAISILDSLDNFHYEGGEQIIGIFLLYIVTSLSPISCLISMSITSSISPKNEQNVPSCSILTQQKLWFFCSVVIFVVPVLIMIILTILYYPT